MARGCKSPLSIFPSPVERVQLEQWQRSTTLQLGLAKRGQIVLLRADALALTEIARCLGVGRRIVRKWLKRFLNRRLAGLSDKPGRGCQPVFPPRWRYIRLRWPASDRISLAGPSPSGIAWNWPDNSYTRALSNASPPRRSAVSWRTIS